MFGKKAEGASASAAKAAKGRGKNAKRPPRRRNQASPAADVRLVPPLSSFDFLEDAFAAAKRGRVIGLGVTVSALAVLTVLALLGVQGLLAKQSAQVELDAVRASNNLALEELAKIDNAGGLGVDQLNAHVTERKTALKKAIGKEIDVVRFTTALRTTAPAGVEISSITFTDAGSSSSSGGESAESTEGASGAEAAPAATATALGSIQVQATVSSFALIGSWTQSVSAIPGLSEVNPTWSGGGESIGTTLNATITAAGATSRAQALVAGEGN